MTRGRGKATTGTAAGDGIRHDAQRSEAPGVRSRHAEHERADRRRDKRLRECGAHLVDELVAAATDLEAVLASALVEAHACLLPVNVTAMSCHLATGVRL
jgi:hypothetical protein